VRSATFFVVAALCLAFILWKLEVRTAITDFLPRDRDSELLDIARELSQAPQARVLVFTLGSDEGVKLDAASAFRERLRASGKFEWVRSGLSQQDQTQLYELLFPARLGLLEQPEGTGVLPDSWLDERVQALRERLAGPLGMVERRLAPDDPLGAFSSLLERQARLRGRLRLDGEQLVTEDGRFAVLFAATRASAFAGAAQREVEQVVESALAEVRRREPSLSLEWSGVSRFASEGERSVRSDIERISTLSVLGIFLLYFAVFRSVREPLLVLLPIAFGCLLATALCQLAFGFVHGLALAFGSSIIGVAEDYSTHYFTHRVATPASEDNETLMRRLWPGMWMGGVTTIVGIAMLFGSGFPGLQQMSLFGAVGVLGALLCTRYVLPSWSRRGPSPRGRLKSVGEGLLAGLAARPMRVLWCLAPALLAGALGLPRLAFDDRVTALRTPAPALEAENERVQERLGRGAPGHMVVALGRDDEQALARSEAVHARLAAAHEAGKVGDFRSVVELVPSLAMQQQRRARLTSDPTFIPRFHAALDRAGFVPDAFAPFEAALAAEPMLLRPQALLSSSLSEWVAPFRLQLAGRVAYITPLSDAPKVDMSKLLADLPEVHYLDQEGLFSAAYGRFRGRVVSMVALGLVLVLATLLYRYRSLKIAALGMLPALLGAAGALGVEALRGVPATLMHVIAALLVLSMGVDYGIYALESRASDEESVTTLGGVLLAALTTVLSFGLLGLSDNPALAAIGSTVGFGMVFTVLASPVVLALVRGAKHEMV